MLSITVRAIVIKSGKLLLVKHGSYGGKPSNDYYCTIGGHLDEGEDIIGGLRREVLEETGVKAKIGRLLFVQQYQDEAEYLEFFFELTNSDDFEKVDLSKASHGHEIAEIGFINPKNIKVLPKFLQEIDFSNLAENSSVKFFNYS